MGAVDTVEWASVLSGHYIQNVWVSRAMNLHQILCEVWTFLCGSYSNDSEACSSGQLVIGSFITSSTCSCITCCAEFFGETSNHPGDSALLLPRFGTSWLLAFPKTKITFERGEIADHQWDSGKYKGAAMATGRTVWGPKMPTLKGTDASLPCVQCFLYLVSSSTNDSFSCYMAGYFLDRLRYLS